jgi:hypothetical protein
MVAPRSEAWDADPEPLVEYIEPTLNLILISGRLSLSQLIKKKAVPILLY